jgi:hypothetical protein
MLLRTVELSPKAEGKLLAAKSVHPDADRAFMAAKWYLTKEAHKGFHVSGGENFTYLYKHSLSFHTVESIIFRYTIDGHRVIVQDIKIDP